MTTTAKSILALSFRKVEASRFNGQVLYALDFSSILVTLYFALDGDVWTKERLGEQDFLDELSATQIQEEVGGTVMVELTNMENEPTNLIMKDEWVLQPIGSKIHFKNNMQ